VHRAWLSTAFAEDVYRLTSEEEIDWERFCAETVRLGLRAPVIHALAYASRKRPIVVADLAMAVLSDMSPLDRAKLWALRRLVGEKRLPGLSHLLVLATRPGRRAAALRASLAPDDRFLRWRYGRRSAPALLAIRAARPFYLAGQGALLLVRILTRLVRGSDAASI
jgi:hypothetical protein